MKEGLRSTTKTSLEREMEEIHDVDGVSRGIVTSNVELGVVNMENLKSESPLILGVSDHSKGLRLCFEGNGSEHVGVGVEVCGNDTVLSSLEEVKQISGNENVEFTKEGEGDAYTHVSNGEGLVGRKRNSLESMEKGDDADKEKIKSPLVSSCSDHVRELGVNVGVVVGVNADSLESAGDTVLPSTAREVEETSGAELVKCSEDAEIGVEVRVNGNGLDSVNNAVHPSPGREVEERSGAEPVKCSEDAKIGPEVRVDANGDVNTHVGNDKDRCQVGKVRRGRKRKNVVNTKKGDDAINNVKDLVISSPVRKRGRKRKNAENPKKGDDAISNVDKEKIESSLISSHLDRSKDLVISSPGKKRGRKRKNVENPKTGDNAISNAVEEKIELPLISSYLDHAKDLVISSPRRKSGRKRKNVENPKNGDNSRVGVEVGVNAIVAADTEKEKGMHKLGKSRRGRIRKKGESPMKGDVATCVDVEERESSLSSYGQDSDNDSVPSTPERKVRKRKGKKRKKGESSESDFDDWAVRKRVKNVQVQVTERVLRPRTIAMAMSGGQKEVDGGMSGGQKEVDSGMSGDFVGEKIEEEINESDNIKVATPKDETAQPIVGVKNKVKGRRGRPPKLQGINREKYGIAGPIGKIRKKLKDRRGRPRKLQGIDTETDEIVHPVGKLIKKLKGPRGRPRKQQGIDTEKAEIARPIGKLVKKLKGRHKRPPKLEGKNGMTEVICKGKHEVSGSKKSIDRPKVDISKGSEFPNLQEQTRAPEEISDEKKKITRSKNNSNQPNAADSDKGSKFPTLQEIRAPEVISEEKPKIMGSKKNSDQPKVNNTDEKGSSFAEDGVHNRITRHSHDAGTSCTGKPVKKTQKNKEQEMGRREEQQLVRLQIIGMLTKAGWSIELRPRLSKEGYNDTVYVEPDGKTHWSVTLAYRKLKKKIDDKTADSRTVSAFTPIPEEVLSTLFRCQVRERNDKGKKRNREKRKKKEGEKGKNKKGEKGKNKKREKGKIKKGKNKTDKGDTMPCEHDNSAGLAHRGRKPRLNSCEHDNSAGLAHRGRKPRLNSKERKNRKPCALLARTTPEKGLGSDVGGFIPYDGKRSLLSWMIDLGTVIPGEKVQYMNHNKTEVMLEGKLTRDGIQCGCCNEIIMVSDFESHSGSKLCQPFCNIYLESGNSLLQCLVDSWSKQEGSDRIGFNFVDIAGDDPNDDTCNICGDGGDLICCDSCPSTFHQNCLDIDKFPSGEWQCVYCLCKFCGTVAGNASQMNDNSDSIVSKLLACRLCEEKFHLLCAEGNNDSNDESKCESFCGMKCREIFEQLQVLVGVKHELEDGFSWTILQRYDVGRDISVNGAPLKVECNSKLAVAFSVMDECFVPIVDQRSGINMIHNVVYGCGSNVSRLNYSCFFTVILERGDEMISAATLRIHGKQLAEMPFIGTRHMYRRQGMCRRLLNAIESALCSLDVEKLVIPAISQLLQTWTSVFGFKPLEESNRQEMKCRNMIVFPGTAMLQKPPQKNRLLDDKFAPDSNIAPELGVQQTLAGTDRCTNPGSQYRSDITNCDEKTVQAMDEGKEAVNCEQERAFKNIELDLNTLGEGSISEFDEPQTLEETDRCTNAQFDPQNGSETTKCEERTVEAMEEGNETVNSEKKREVKFFGLDLNSLGEGSEISAFDGPDSQASSSNEVCKSMEFQSGVNNGDIPGVKSSSLSCEIAGNNSHDLNEDFTASQTDSLSPITPQLCSKSSEQAESESQAHHINGTLGDTKPLRNSSSVLA